MISQKTIDRVKDRLVDVYKPLEIYLFGSYAWGHPTEDSDLDLLIVVSDSKEKSYRRSIPGSWALMDIMISKDLFVYTKDEFEKRAGDVTTLCYKVAQEGKKIYAQS